MYLHAKMHVYTNACLVTTHIHSFIHTYRHIYIYLHVCLTIYKHIYMHKHIYASTFIHVYTYIHKYTHIHTYIHGDSFMPNTDTQTDSCLPKYMYTYIQTYIEVIYCSLDTYIILELRICTIFIFAYFQISRMSILLPEVNGC